MAETGLTQENVQLIDRIANFIHRHRKVFWGSLAGIVVVLMGVLVYVEFQKKYLEESTRRIEEVLKQVSKYHQASGEEKEKTEKEIFKELDAILSTYPSYYAAVRALHVKADLLFEKKEYKAASELWETLAKKYPKSHLAPIALMRVAVCKEEVGDLDGALQALKEVDTRYGKTFPETPHILFSMGRLYEAKRSYSEAANAYNRLVDEYPQSSWTKLARNRLIYFKVSNIAVK